MGKQTSKPDDAINAEIAKRIDNAETVWLSIDPGMSMGIVCWRGSTIQLAERFKCRRGASTQERVATSSTSLLEVLNQYKPELVVIEQPEFFMSNKGIGAAARGSLESVCYIFGGLVAVASLSGCLVRTVTPKLWKGNTPKQVMLNFIASKLTDEWAEKTRKFPDIGDAIGLGLWNLGRI